MKYSEQQQELSKEYQQRFARIEDYRNRVWVTLTEQFLSHYVNPSDTVLDLGCGWGEFIRNIRAEKKHAMDLNPEAGERLPADIDFHCQDCSTSWDVADNTLDVVFSSKFFEYLPTKEALKQTLREAKRCLRPGGKLICLGPNIRFLHGRYWDFWDHHVALSDLSLTEILKLVDFRIDECIPRFLPYTMARESQPPVALVSLYLKLRIVWPIFGKQFLVIGEA